MGYLWSTTSKEKRRKVALVALAMIHGLHPTLYNFKYQRMPGQELGSGRNSSSRTASELHCSGEGFSGEESHSSEPKSPHCLLYPRAVVQEGFRVYWWPALINLYCYIREYAVILDTTECRMDTTHQEYSFVFLFFSLKMGMKSQSSILTSKDW